MAKNKQDLNKQAEGDFYIAFITLLALAKYPEFFSFPIYLQYLYIYLDFIR